MEKIPIHQSVMRSYPLVLQTTIDQVYLVQNTKIWHKEQWRNSSWVRNIHNVWNILIPVTWYWFAEYLNGHSNVTGFVSNRQTSYRMLYIHFIKNQGLHNATDLDLTSITSLNNDLEILRGIDVLLESKLKAPIVF